MSGHRDPAHVDERLVDQVARTVGFIDGPPPAVELRCPPAHAWQAAGPLEPAPDAGGGGGRSCLDCGRPISSGSTSQRCRACWRRAPVHIKQPLANQPRRVIVQVLRELVLALTSEELELVLDQALPPQDLPLGYVRALNRDLDELLLEARDLVATLKSIGDYAQVAPKACAYFVEATIRRFGGEDGSEEERLEAGLRHIEQVVERLVDAALGRVRSR